MKAVVVSEFGPPDVLKYIDVKEPNIGPHQVLIKSSATSVNFADIKAKYGNYGADKPPFIPGLDIAGTIAQVGESVENFNKGDRVIAFSSDGSYAEYVVADSILTYSLPDSLDFQTAAACPTVSFTSYNLLAKVARIVPGESVVIHAAAGGVGSTAIQIAKILGAEKVIGVVSTEEKVNTALQAGASHVINSSKDKIVETVLELTNGTGVDVILDSIGGSTTELGLNYLAPYGRLVQFGNAGGEKATITLDDFYKSCRSILGYSLGTTRKKRPHTLIDTSESVFNLLKDGSLKMVIDHTLPLKDAHIAHRIMEDRKSKGKILLIP